MLKELPPIFLLIASLVALKMYLRLSYASLTSFLIVRIELNAIVLLVLTHHYFW